MFLYFMFLLFFVASCLCYQESTNFERRLDNHSPISLDSKTFSEIINLTDRSNIESLIDQILIPRVVGSDGHATVRNFIAEHLKNLSWNVEFDSFEDVTPNFGTLTFHNIIATKNPYAKRFLILACHYDSKYFKNEEFLGATDSAIPCAMLLNIATVLNTYLEASQSSDVSLMLVFFDGEEAFVNWSATDSLYGSRHLAEKWEAEGFLPNIDMLVLLDLLGAPDPSFYSFFKTTESWYLRLCSIEARLANDGHLEHYTSSSATVSRVQQNYFKQRSTNSYIEDDHVPFLKRDVPILHLIPTPFPSTWHKITDSKENIELAVVENLTKIMYIFVMEYLEL